MHCKSWDKLAKVRVSVWSLKWCKSGSDVAPWAAMHRYYRHLCSTTPAAGLSSLPSWEGNEREASCFFSGLRKIQQIRNPPSVLPVIHHIMHKSFFYLASVSEILLHFIFQMRLITGGAWFTFTFVTCSLQLFFFNKLGLGAVWKVAKSTQGRTWFILGSMAAKTMYTIRASLWKRIGKEKWHLSTLIKPLARNQSFMGVKVFSISKSELWLEVQRAWFCLKGEMFQNL